MEPEARAQNIRELGDTIEEEISDIKLWGIEDSSVQIQFSSVRNCETIRLRIAEDLFKGSGRTLELIGELIDNIGTCWRTY